MHFDDSLMGTMMILAGEVATFLLGVAALLGMMSANRAGPEVVEEDRRNVNRL